MNIVYFWKQDDKNYNNNKWRRYFCQWYIKDFIGGPACYDMSSIIIEEDWIKYIDKKIFSSREKWMMVMKALLFARGIYRKINLTILENNILPIDDPSKIRLLGRTIKGFDEKLWIEWRYKIVVNGNYLQFSQNDELKTILLKTNDDLIVEASPKDKIWGIGFSETQAQKVDKTKWGLNLLGLALIEVRQKIKNEL